MLTQIWSTTDLIFCHFRPFFALLPHDCPEKFKFGKNVKCTWRYYPFRYVYHKPRSYDVWFLRYKVQRTKVFVILGHFLSFDSPNNPKNQNFETKKWNSWRYYYFTLAYHKWQSWCMVPDISSAIDRFFCHFGLFFALYPTNNAENQNFEKMKKLLEILSF